MEAIRQTIVDVDLTKKLHRVFSGMLLGMQDKLANRMGANVYQDGQAADLSGYAVKGYFIRNGTETIVIDNGTVSGNTAYVELPGNCYFNDGSYTLTVKLVKDNVEQTLVIFDGQIAETITDAIVENESVINVTDFIQQDWLNRVETAAETALEQAAIATEAATAVEEAWHGVQDGLAQKAPAIFVDASGDIVTITDGAEGMPMQSLITHVEPVQEGSGDPGPDNIRNIIGWNEASVTGTGKNLFGGETLADRFQSVMTVTRDDEARTISFYAANASGKVFFTDFKPGTRYTIILYGRNGSGQTNTYIRYTDGTTGKPLFVESGADCYAVYTTNAGKSVEAFMGSYSSGTTVLYYDKCGIFEGVLTEADFAEYQGKTLTAALPETLYGFDKNWTTGMVTVTHISYVLDGVNNKFGGVYTANGLRYAVYLLPFYGDKSNNKTSLLTSHLKTVQRVEYGCAYIAGADGQQLLAYIKDFTDVAEANAWLVAQAEAGTPFQICYKLAEPYTIQLTPQQLETLKGVNNIWSNAGETTVTYAADTKMYIDNKIAAIAAAIV